MQNIHEIQEKIFFEAKIILETLSKISSKDELLAKQDLFTEITDRIAFLRILEKNKDVFVTETPVENIDNKEVNSYFNPEEIPENEAISEEIHIEEEVIFTNELNDIDNEKITEKEDLPEVSVPEDSIKISAAAEERITQKEKEFRELEERRRKIIEFNKGDTAVPQKEEIFEEERGDLQTEKKFKLANIKGLKSEQSIFDDDSLEKLQETEKKETDKEPGSLLKANMPTDFMEAEKPKPAFRLDLNDKMAFTNMLFKGNDEELKFTIDKLNSFDNADDAKQYLSEIYYLKDWSKVDEYAQRLWALVENKFI